MNIQTICNGSLTLFGAIIMLISIVRTKSLTTLIPFVPERHQSHIKRHLILHRGLMIFFFFGYLVVLVAFTFQYSLVSEVFVSVIFFLGAIFVFIGIDVQSRLLSEVHTTLKGILPICSKCKKIRLIDGNPSDPKAWKKIENFISEKASVEFSHGYCPECFEKEMKNLERMKGIAK